MAAWSLVEAGDERALVVRPADLPAGTPRSARMFPGRMVVEFDGGPLVLEGVPDRAALPLLNGHGILLCEEGGPRVWVVPAG